MAGNELLFPLGAAAAAGAVTLVALVFLGEPPAWAIAAPALVFLGAMFWGWVLTYRRLQALEDLPPARIGSAAQGYTRLEGRAAPFPGNALRSPVTNQPCCWYSYSLSTLDRRGNVKSREAETTEWSFMMSDGSGECVVDPAGARMVPTRVNRYQDREQMWKEEVILARDPLCVIGEFTTSGTSVSEAEIELRTGELLAEWKKTRKFTVEEWEGVRASARGEVEADIARHPPQPQNRIGRPRDGRPFVISAEGEDQLERDLTIWAWLHVFLFVGGAAALAYFLL